MSHHGLECFKDIFSKQMSTISVIKRSCHFFLVEVYIDSFDREYHIGSKHIFYQPNWKHIAITQTIITPYVCSFLNSNLWKNSIYGRLVLSSINFRYLNGICPFLTNSRWFNCIKYQKRIRYWTILIWIRHGTIV